MTKNEFEMDEPEIIEYKDTKYQKVTEGKATVIFPAEEKRDVFYNPIQQFNRDITITAIKAWEQEFLNPLSNNDAKKKKKSFTVFEGLAATGLRSLRFAKELPSTLDKVIANDLSKDAVKAIDLNTEYNDLKDKVVSMQGSCNVSLLLSLAQENETKGFDIIDLDPYGTAAPFIDSAIQGAKDGGMLCVTCTDSQVLCGNTYPEKCFSLYGGVNMMNSVSTHESALRLLIMTLKQSAARYGKYVTPRLCLSIDYYIRVFVTIEKAPLKVKDLITELGSVKVCNNGGCQSFFEQPFGEKHERVSKKNKPFTKISTAKSINIGENCPFCDKRLHVVGPMYLGPLQDEKFCQKILDINQEHENNGEGLYGTTKRIEGMVSVAKSEVDNLFYFSPSLLSGVLKVTVPSLRTVINGLGSMGYKCSLTHAAKSCIKTDASWDAIWYVMKKCGTIENPEYKPKLNDKMPGFKIWNDDTIGHTLTSEQKEKFNLKDDNSETKKFLKLQNSKIVKYQENPKSNWGPMSRPK
ncbi:hypothetical protein FOG50_01007 [Hanseniaspora uvarum]|nr:hypothetical protein FOG50_01007 [Hanseniaspora uvarum]